MDTVPAPVRLDPSAILFDEGAERVPRRLPAVQPPQDQFSITADLTPVPALPLAGAIVLALLLLIRGTHRRAART